MDVVELVILITTIKRSEGKLMAAIDDLKAEVVTLSTSVSAILAAVIAKVDVPNPTEAEIAAAVVSLKDLQSKLDTETTILTA